MQKMKMKVRRKGRAKKKTKSSTITFLCFGPCIAKSHAGHPHYIDGYP